ncbi:MAG: ABC transporter substrate-binding protein [Clostridiales bacterium]|jgi:ABC-type Fe3+-hydroxamate transport system substrate-binding protein|nr:ABC transporter substrate-binding protein [Clostridiales bacterium]
MKVTLKQSTKKAGVFVCALLTAVSLFAFAACVRDDDTPPPTNQNAYTREGLAEKFLAKADGEVTVNETTVTVKDESGADSVTIPKNPQKVYNLYASFTTLWYEAGGTVSGLIGGASSSDLYIEQIGRDVSKDDGVKVVATSSAGSRWSPETIVADQPDLIICSTAMSGYSTIKSPAQSAGIPVLAMSYDGFEDYFKWFKVFCNLTGKPELWDSVAKDTLNKVTDILMRVPLENNPSVFLMFTAAGNDLQANLSGTVVGDMAKQLRATNIADAWFNNDQAIRLPINLESVYLSQPDFIMVQCHAESVDAEAQVAEQYGPDSDNGAVWSALNAVKANRISYLQRSLFHNKPNRKFADAYLIMAEILYPDTDFQTE